MGHCHLQYQKQQLSGLCGLWDPVSTNQKLASGNGQRFSTKMDPSYPSATPIFRKGPLGKNSPTTGGRGLSSYLYTQIPLDYKASSNPK